MPTDKAINLANKLAGSTLTREDADHVIEQINRCVQPRHPQGVLPEAFYMMDAGCGIFSSSGIALGVWNGEYIVEWNPENRRNNG